MNLHDFYKALSLCIYLFNVCVCVCFKINFLFYILFKEHDVIITPSFLDMTVFVICSSYKQKCRPCFCPWHFPNTATVNIQNYYFGFLLDVGEQEQLQDKSKIFLVVFFLL